MLQGIQMRIRCRRFDWVIARRRMDSAGSVNWKNSAVGTLCPDILAKKRRTMDDCCAPLSVSAFLLFRESLRQVEAGLLVLLEE